MSRANIAKHYARIATRWPKDVIRPEVQFQNLLNKRINAAPAASIELNGVLDQVLPTRRARSTEQQEINALYSLLEDRYSKSSPFTPAMMNPKAAPTYYSDLEKQLAETPSRSWFSNIFRRISGMVRLR